MGEDKYESKCLDLLLPRASKLMYVSEVTLMSFSDEELLKWGFPEDVW